MVTNTDILHKVNENSYHVRHILQTSYRKRMMKSNDIGKRDTLTVDWLNIWKHPKKPQRMSHTNLVSYICDKWSIVA